MLTNGNRVIGSGLYWLTERFYLSVHLQKWGKSRKILAGIAIKRKEHLKRLPSSHDPYRNTNPLDTKHDVHLINEKQFKEYSRKIWARNS
jgi:hypothetical protein